MASVVFLFLFPLPYFIWKRKKLFNGYCRFKFLHFFQTHFANLEFILTSNKENLFTFCFNITHAMVTRLFKVSKTNLSLILGLRVKRECPYVDVLFFFFISLFRRFCDIDYFFAKHISQRPWYLTG